MKSSVVTTTNNMAATSDLDFMTKTCKRGIKTGRRNLSEVSDKFLLYQGQKWLSGESFLVKYSRHSPTEVISNYANFRLKKCLTLNLLAPTTEGARINSWVTNVIYIYIYMEHLFLMFLDHTQQRTTVGKTPLDE